jgi:hypothetical protein
MAQLALFNLGIVSGLIAWSIVVYHYVWPELRSRSRAEALRPLLMLHSFRFIGLAFLVPGVVAPELPAAFAQPAAYGDFVAAVLAVLALAGLPHRFGAALVWLFNIWGSADLVYAFYQGFRVGLEPGQLGATYFILTIVVPLLLVTHALVFRLLLQGASAAAVAPSAGVHRP